ncbi:MAG: YqgE/AlgH family protein [Deltaproteobacteria bacterium]|nr:YqgE/AlgH family protein [Deltaproteobacteria bacterium]
MQRERGDSGFLPRRPSGSVSVTVWAAVLVCSLIAAPYRARADEAGRYLTGQLLVAAPEMADPNFVRTVIFVVKHDGGGAMGLVVNRPVAKGPVKDLLESLGLEVKGASGEIILHYGGPVEPARGFMLHSDDYVLDSTTVVEKGIALTSDAEVLRAIGQGRGPRRKLFALGYAGWAPGQLEAEIKAKAWFTIPAEQDLIFGPAFEGKWERALEKRKIEL